MENKLISKKKKKKERMGKCEQKFVLTLISHKDTWGNMIWLNLYTTYTELISKFPQGKPFWIKRHN